METTLTWHEALEEGMTTPAVVGMLNGRERFWLQPVRRGVHVVVLDPTLQPENVQSIGFNANSREEAIERCQELVRQRYTTTVSGAIS